MKKTVFVWAMVALSLFSSCSFDARGEASDDVARSASSNAVGTQKSIGEGNIIPFDSSKIIYNPDMGFYNAIPVKLHKDGTCEITDKKYLIFPEENPSEKHKIFTGLKINSAMSDWSKIIEGSNFNLLNIKVDLSEFSSTGTYDHDSGIPTFGQTYSKITNTKGIEELLEAVEKAGKTCFIGFAYSWSDPKAKIKNQSADKEKEVYLPTEPKDFDLILDNIDILCSALKGHEKAITGIMCRTLGPWGECHGTPYCNGIGSDGKIHLKNIHNDLDLLEISYKDYLDSVSKTGSDSYKKDGKKYEADKNYFIRKVIDKWLSCDLKVPFLVRQPAFIEECINHNKLGINGKDIIGIYNGAIFADWTDMSTFKGVKDGDATGRANAIDAISEYTKKTPYGSEISYHKSDNKKPERFLIGDKTFDSKGKTIDGLPVKEAVKEMGNVHLSFLNISFNSAPLKELATLPYNGESVFSYMAEHLGYRYKISGREFDKDRSKGILTISFKIENEGFANMPFHREKVPYICILKAGEKPTTFIEGIKITSQKLNWQTKSMSFDVPISGYEPGKYDIYIRFDDEEPSKIAPNGAYAIRFTGREWNEVLHAHKIKTMTL